jgi:hypothetical protein
MPWPDKNVIPMDSETPHIVRQVHMIPADDMNSNIRISAQKNRQERPGGPHRPLCPGYIADYILSFKIFNIKMLWIILQVMYYNYGKGESKDLYVTRIVNRQSKPEAPHGAVEGH